VLLGSKERSSRENSTYHTAFYNTQDQRLEAKLSEKYKLIVTFLNILLFSHRLDGNGCPQAAPLEYAEDNPKKLISRFTWRMDGFPFAKSKYTGILR